MKSGGGGNLKLGALSGNARELVIGAVSAFDASCVGKSGKRVIISYNDLM
jgi:hypothetical protein